MRIEALEIAGVFLARSDEHADERGSLTRTFDADVFGAHGIDPRVVQCSFVKNRRRGTLRGLHYQAESFPEQKLVTCVTGSLIDVVVDVRIDSPTRGHWLAVELAGGDGKTIVVPPGVAHGYQTHEDDTHIWYQMNAPYVQAAARGHRYDDPSFGIRWPDIPGKRIVSQRDLEWPPFR